MTDHENNAHLIRLFRDESVAEKRIPKGVKVAERMVEIIEEVFGDKTEEFLAKVVGLVSDSSKG